MLQEPMIVDPNEEIAGNRVYYFVIINGYWRGYLTFHMHEWRQFWTCQQGLRDRILTLGMTFIQYVFGNSTIVSHARAFPSWGTFGVATNTLRISKFGITLYFLREHYVLDPNGTNVFVHSRERFGPIPFLFESCKKNRACVGKDGSYAEYFDVPLLDVKWRGRYDVLERGHINGELRSEWASARAVIKLEGEASAEDLAMKQDNRRPLKSLDDVLARLCMYRDFYETVRDSRAIFTHAYATITEIFKEKLLDAGFDDVNWVVALDIAFAEEYF